MEREYDIPVKSDENIEVIEEPNAEKVYSDLNLPEIINDVRLLRQEINGARRSFKLYLDRNFESFLLSISDKRTDLRKKKARDEWLLIVLFFKVTMVVAFLSYVLISVRESDDDKLYY